jgi:methylamine dehydrogenase light chain
MIMRKNWLNRLDGLTETLVRNTARIHSRRAFLSGLGKSLIGIGTLTLLPVYRGGALADEAKGEKGDPNSCDYWRHCAIDGFLCGCCGGSMTSCPPGTIPSDITWIGTCRNPVDDKNYIISYHDCCGKSSCGSCACQRDQDNTPIYRPQTSNHLNWCTGSQAGVPYHCSLSVVLGVKD